MTHVQSGTCGQPAKFTDATRALSLRRIQELLANLDMTSFVRPATRTILAKRETWGVREEFSCLHPSTNHYYPEAQGAPLALNERPLGSTPSGKVRAWVDDKPDTGPSRASWGQYLVRMTQESEQPLLMRLMGLVTAMMVMTRR